MIKVNAMSYAKLIKALMDGTRTLAELAEETGLHYLTVAQYCAALYKEGAIHICLWESDTRGREVVKIYRLGEGRDAKRPKMTAAERQARTRAKHKQAAMLAMMAGGNHEHTSAASRTQTV